MLEINNQVDDLLSIVEGYFPNDSEIIIAYLIFYKRYCELIKHGYIKNKSIELIENDLVGTEPNKGIKEVFQTLKNLDTSFSLKIFHNLTKYLSSLSKMEKESGLDKLIEINISNEKEGKFETILSYIEGIDVRLTLYPIPQFGVFYNNLLKRLYHKEDESVNEFVLDFLSFENNAKVFLPNPEIGEIILLAQDKELTVNFYLDAQNSLQTQLNLIMNGIYDYQLCEKDNLSDINWIVINNVSEPIFNFEKLLFTYIETATRVITALPIPFLSSANFIKETYRNLYSIIELNVDKYISCKNNIAFLQKNCNKKKILLVRENKANGFKQIYDKVVEFYDRGVGRKGAFYEFITHKEIIKTEFKLDLKPKEDLNHLPLTSLQLILLDIKQKLESTKNINKDKDSILEEFQKALNYLYNDENQRWNNLYLFFQSIISAKNHPNIRLEVEETNLALYELKIDINLFHSLINDLIKQLSSFFEDNQFKVLIKFEEILNDSKLIKVSFWCNKYIISNLSFDFMDYITVRHQGSIHTNLVTQSNINNFAYQFSILLPFPTIFNYRKPKITNIEKDASTGKVINITTKEVDAILYEIGQNTIQGLEIKDIIKDEYLNKLSSEMYLDIKINRLKSSLAILKRTKEKLGSFKIKLGKEEDEAIDNTFKEQVKGILLEENWNSFIEKDIVNVTVTANDEHKPIQILDFFNAFHDSDWLKFISHDYDKGRFDYKIFITEVENEFGNQISKTPLPASLRNIIEDFINRDKSNRNNENKIKIGWRDKELEKWCLSNPPFHPIRSDFYRINMIDPFKKLIQFRSSDLINALQSCIKEKLGVDNDFNISYVDVKGVSFYTNVEGILSGIQSLFAPIKERKDISKDVEISVIETYNKNKQLWLIELRICHINSPSDRRHDPNKLLRGDLNEAQQRFRNICNWSIEGQFKDGCFQINILNDNKDIPLTKKLEPSEIKGFTHILTFYS